MTEILWMLLGISLTMLVVKGKKPVQKQRTPQLNKNKVMTQKVMTHPWEKIFDQNMATYYLNTPYVYEYKGMEISTDTVTLIDASPEEIVAIDTDTGQILGRYDKLDHHIILARLVTHYEK